MTRSHEVALLIGAALLTGACAWVPTGPSTTAARENGTTFTEFRSYDQACRGWAARQIQNEDALTDSLQSRYDAAYLPCMSAEQGRPSHIATSTFFPPTPPGLIPPLIELPSFTFPPMLPTAPAGVQSVPGSVGPPAGLALGPG
jgi:hypothetical protein